MKGKTRIIAKFRWTDKVICSHSRERKPPSYSRRRTVYYQQYNHRRQAEVATFSQTAGDSITLPKLTYKVKCRASATLQDSEIN